jgi:hypothetical protein
MDHIIYRSAARHTKNATVIAALLVKVSKSVDKLASLHIDALPLLSPDHFWFLRELYRLQAIKFKG